MTGIELVSVMPRGILRRDLLPRGLVRPALGGGSGFRWKGEITDIKLVSDCFRGELTRH